MIETIDNILPSDINRKIISYLVNEQWNFARDFKTNEINHPHYNKFFNGEMDMGMSILSYHKDRNICLSSALNLYAEIIYSIVKQKTKYKFIEPTRFYWNWYNTNSITDFHKDEEDNRSISFVYNLHTNDGGTMFKDNNLIVSSNEGQAVLFPSNLEHKGIAPKKYTSRFNLNCIATIQI
jgi:hypothetical protein